jgi:hypothetical protein
MSRAGLPGALDAGVRVVPDRGRGWESLIRMKFANSRAGRMPLDARVGGPARGREGGLIPNAKEGNCHQIRRQAAAGWQDGLVPGEEAEAPLKHSSEQDCPGYRYRNSPERSRGFVNGLIGLMIVRVLVLITLSPFVQVAEAAPDTFYRRTATPNDGRQMTNGTAGSAGTNLAITSTGLIKWYPSATYTTGGGDASIPSGTYTLTMGRKVRGCQWGRALLARCLRRDSTAADPA